MRKLLTALLTVTVVMLTSEAQAQNWSTEDTAWELAYLATHVADWGQTLDIASQCNTGQYSETNIVMGDCPSAQAVNAYFIGTALVHMTVAHMLPTKYRRSFQSTTFAMQLGFVANNANIGLSMKF